MDEVFFIVMVEVVIIVNSCFLICNSDSVLDDELIFLNYLLYLCLIFSLLLGVFVKGDFYCKCVWR